jgi:hypothetical protein
METKAGCNLEAIRRGLIFLHGVLFSLRDSIKYQLYPA